MSDSSLALEMVASAMGEVPGLGVAGPGVVRLGQALERHLERRTSRALRTVQAISGMSLTEMAERVASDPQLVPLLIRVLRAAGSVGYDGALDAMAEALGGALKDPATVDEALLIVPALESFGPCHGLILEQVARHSGTTAEGESKHRDLDRAKPCRGDRTAVRCGGPVRG